MRMPGPGPGPLPKSPGLRDGREVLCVREGRGAEVGPGDRGASPTVLMSSGWNSPRRNEFLIYTQNNSVRFLSHCRTWMSDAMDIMPHLEIGHLLLHLIVIFVKQQV